MSQRSYHVTKGGLPKQTERMDMRASFTHAYAFMPGNTMCDIVVSYLPHWDRTRAWVIARPLSGLAETFSQYIVEVEPGGGSSRPDTTLGVESVLFVTGGSPTLELGGDSHILRPGSYVFIAPGEPWALSNPFGEKACFHWLRKLYEPVDGLDSPESFVTHDDDIIPVPMADTDGRWATTRFVDIEDMRHDMHVNIVTFQPGAVIPFPETHVMEHGIFVLQGKGTYRLNQDWIEVEAGDFMWLRAFCPQACYAAGDEPFRYLLYKDVNRHVKLGSFLR
ncbi:MAG: bifunctional allantoicase/(S)-ureidoglycine aminohydrolase [Pseudomonadota bacterium]